MRLLPAVSERWLPVRGYEGLYEVSDLGRVRSIDRVAADGYRKLSGKVLSQNTFNHHRSVMLYKDNSRKRKLVHHLVLEAFVGPRPDGLLGLHYDDDPANNRLDNLRWGTKSENSFDSVRNNNHPASRKTHCKRGHLLAEPNLVVSEAKKGKRSCLACARANGTLYRSGMQYGEAELQELGDEKFKAIMGLHDV